MPIENRIAAIIFLVFTAVLLITCVTHEISSWWKFRRASGSASDRPIPEKQSAQHPAPTAQVQVQLNQNLSVILKTESE